MAITDNWTSKDLKGIATGGLIREDVMNEIWDISKIPLPFTDLIGSDTADNSYTEWTEDQLSEPDVDNARPETYEPTTNDSKGGARIGNHCQISTKTVKVTHRADASDTIGRAKELAYQVMMRQRELRRDVEAIALTNQGSDDAATENDPTFAAALGACITQGNLGSSTGGGFSSGAWADRVAGTARPLTETMVRDVAQLVWEQGGNPSVLMSVPGVIRQLSNYMFTDSARIATLSRETKGETDGATALGSVNVFITDFGVTLDMIPNRLQQGLDDATPDTPVTVANVYVIDPAYARLSYLEGYRTDPLAKTGLANTRLMSCDWTLKVLNRNAHGIICDIDPSAPVTL